MSKVKSESFILFARQNLQSFIQIVHKVARAVSKTVIMQICLGTAFSKSNWFFECFSFLETCNFYDNSNSTFHQFLNQCFVGIDFLLAVSQSKLEILIGSVTFVVINIIALFAA
jgi:hypothetical protein